MPFLNNLIEPDTRNVIICLFVFCLSFTPSKANRQVQLPEAPYEVRFADVYFQFTDATRNLFKHEVERLVKDKDAERRDLTFLRLFTPVTRPILSKWEVHEDFNYLLVYNKYQSGISETILREPGVFWCMSKEQAREVDLKVNETVDERKHLTLSTQAAGIALRRNNVLYNNWGTTLFAQLVSKEVLNATGVNQDWNGKMYLLIDSPAYASLIQFLAFKWVMENELKSFVPDKAREVILYPYGKGKRLSLIAVELRLDPEELQKQNLWIAESEKITGDNPLVIVIADESRVQEIKELAEIAANIDLPEEELGFPVLINDQTLAREKGGSFYRINELKGLKSDFCDSPVTLAYKGDISLKSFLEYNELEEDEVLVPGKVYYLEEKNSKGPIAYHISRKGESLWGISMTYGVKLSELLRYNRMNENQVLQRGRMVWLQEKRPKGEEVEYVDVKAKMYPDSLLNDPVFEGKTAFSLDQEKEEAVAKESLMEEPEVELDSTAEVKEKLVEAKVQEEVYILTPEPAKNEIVVKPVPKKALTETLKEAVEDEKKENDYVVHTVRKGETLYRISVNYKVPLNQLYNLNHLSSNIIEIGDQIKVKRL